MDQMQVNLLRLSRRKLIFQRDGRQNYSFPELRFFAHCGTCPPDAIIFCRLQIRRDDVLLALTIALAIHPIISIIERDGAGSSGWRDAEHDAGRHLKKICGLDESGRDCSNGPILSRQFDIANVNCR
jgi:hypothetical protein